MNDLLFKKLKFEALLLLLSGKSVTSQHNQKIYTAE